MHEEMRPCDVEVEEGVVGLGEPEEEPMSRLGNTSRRDGRFPFLRGVMFSAILHYVRVVGIEVVEDDMVEFQEITSYISTVVNRSLTIANA